MCKNKKNSNGRGHRATDNTNRKQDIVGGAEAAEVAKKLHAELLLRQYGDALKLRQKGVGKVLDGSQACADALEGLQKYFGQFPDILNKAKTITANGISDALDWADADYSAEDVESGALRDHFEEMAIY